MSRITGVIEPSHALANQLRSGLRLPNHDNLDRLLDEMLDELDPAVWAHHTILNCLMRELVPRQRYIMRMVMEDLDLREAYENAVARLPAKPRQWLA